MMKINFVKSFGLIDSHLVKYQSNFKFSNKLKKHKNVKHQEKIENKENNESLKNKIIDEKIAKETKLSETNNLKPIEYSLENMNKIMKEQENNYIEYNIFKLKDYIDPNHFGQIVVYYSYNILIKQYTKNFIEFSGPITLTGLTFLNYFGMIFPSAYVFNYLIGMTIASYMKLIWKMRFTKTIIYQLTILDNNTMRITYIDGSQEDVLIENLNFTSKMISKMILHEKQPPRASLFPIEVRVNGKSDAFVILNTDPNSASHVEFFTLVGILNKNTKQVLFKI